jgi:tRNA-dihydrouridine synthase A
MDNARETTAVNEVRGRLDRRICVAPMMDYTDRHCRYFMRLLSPGALLYSEMINALAIVHGRADRLLGFDPSEQPVALQLGGNDPSSLAAAARVGERFGYVEINLNCGCPSDRVKNGGFGACLMADSQRVADCVDAMRQVVSIPVTVKCRIGIEPSEQTVGDYEFLADFIRTIHSAGTDAFIIHARKAVLGGLSPKQNREIPPLRYDVVLQLRREFPDLQLIVNGGITTSAEVVAHLSSFDGVMIGRQAYQQPYWLSELHREIQDANWIPPEREHVLERYVEYVERRREQGDAVPVMVRHVQGLYAGLPNARAWRRFISEQASAGADPHFLRESLRIVRQAA